MAHVEGTIHGPICVSEGECSPATSNVGSELAMSFYVVTGSVDGLATLVPSHYGVTAEGDNSYSLL